MNLKILFNIILGEKQIFQTTDNFCILLHCDLWKNLYILEDKQMLNILVDLENVDLRVEFCITMINRCKY